MLCTPLWSVQAGDVYIKKYLSQSAPVETPQTQAPYQRNFANRFYDNCLKRANAVLQGENLQLMCACTSAQITKGMTNADLASLEDSGPAGLAARNKMMLNIYAPCMEFPAKALMDYRCINTPELKGKVRNVSALCSCVSEYIAKYMAQNAPSVMANAIRTNPGTLDPMAALVDSPEFEQQSQSYLLSCLSKGF